MKKIKRILAFALCVCMVAGLFYPTEQVSAEGNGGSGVALPYTDSFTDETAYKTAIGTFGTTSESQLTIDTTNGVLKNMDATSSKGYQRFACFQGLNVSTNYSVSADVMIGNSSRFATVGAYANEEGKGYEFGIIGNNAGPYFRIYNRMDGASVIGAKNSEAVTKWFESYKTGDLITLGIDASTSENNVVTLKCWAIYGGVKKEIFNCSSDTTANMTLTSGYPCLSSSDNNKDNDGHFASITVTALVEDVKTDYLYEDNFSTDEKYNSLKNADTNSYVLQDGVLKMTDSDKEWLTVFDRIENGTELSNYMVEADFTFGNTKGSNSIMVYGNRPTDGNKTYTTGYEFGIVNNNFRLYQKQTTSKASSVLSSATASNHSIQKYFEAYEPGDTIRLALTVITNEDGSVSITAAATYKGVKKVIYQCNDNSDGKFTKGAPGFRGKAENSTIDNITVRRVTVPDSTCGKTDLAYYDVANDSQFSLYGVTYDADKKVFARMDLETAEQIAGSTDYSGTSVYTHACESAGGRIRFRTDSSYVAVKATFPSYTQHSRLMAAGKTGFDVYVGNTYYDTIYPLQLPANESTEWTYTGLVEFDTAEARDITIYFPITQEVSEVSVGLQSTATVSAYSKAYDEVAPIVYYGSSITQGGNSTRPGLTYVNTIGRTINRNYIDLGVWGSARGQEAFANYIAGLDMSIFVLDYDHNEQTAEALASKHETFYKIVRTAHPDIPVVFVSRPNQSIDSWEACREVIYTTYQNALKRDENVFFIDGQSFFEGEEYCLSDGTHPTDKGQALMAASIGGLLQEIIAGKQPSAPDPEKVDITLPFTETFDRTQDELSSYWNNGATVAIQYVDGSNQAVLDGTTTSMYLTQDSDTLNWSNYVYEADVTMTETEFNSKLSNAMATIVAGANDKNQGYEFSLMYSNKNDTFSLRLYDRIHAKVIERIDFEAEFGVPILLRMEVLEDTIKCYANGKQVIVASDLKDVKGTIGIVVAGREATFDNLSVTQYTEGEQPGEPEKADITLPFTETFDRTQDELSSYWNNGATVAIQYVDGSNQAVLDGTTTSMYLTQDSDTLNWSNYVYEADVTMTETEFNSKLSNAMATIVAGANDKNQGYEFSLMYSNKNDTFSLRLYDRIHGDVIKKIDFEMELNVPLLMRMEVMEDTIRCYANGELVIAATDLKGVSGTVGFVVAGRMAAFDNLSVTKLENKTITAPVANSDGIYYADDFSEAVVTEGNKWSDVILNISDERAALSGEGKLYLTNDEGFLLLSDYTVAAKVNVSPENDSYEKTIVASIVSRTFGSSTGYEFGIVFSGNESYARLYDRTTKKVLETNEDMTFEMGKEYLLTMICEGDIITCYVDGTKAFSVQDGTNKTGSAGLRTIGTVYYDDFVLGTPAYASRFVSYTPIISSPATGDASGKWNILYGTMMVMAIVLIMIEWIASKRRRMEE